MKSFRILSLDGGGIRGLFTATLLGRLLARRPKLVASADLIAGTSTGGILALGLAAGLEPSQLARLYSEQGAKIFDDSTWDEIRDLGRAIGADYDQRALGAELVRQFGQATLGDLRKRVLIPTFDLDAPAKRGRPRMWKPKFFHNFPGSDSDRREKVVDVALRTSAAPTYFPTYQGYVDGGLVANNPSMAAVAQALDPRAAGRGIHELVVLSIGTGTEPMFIRGDRLDWGWAQWARPLVTLMISGVEGVADFQCRQLLGRRYFRLDQTFDSPIGLDDVRPATLDRLVQEAERLPLRSVLRWLESHDW